MKPFKKSSIKLRDIFCIHYCSANFYSCFQDNQASTRLVGGLEACSNTLQPPMFFCCPLNHEEELEVAKFQQVSITLGLTKMAGKSYELIQIHQ